jgi:hypothetical protein
MRNIGSIEAVAALMVCTIPTAMAIHGSTSRRGLKRSVRNLRGVSSDRMFSFTGPVCQQRTNAHQSTSSYAWKRTSLEHRWRVTSDHRVELSRIRPRSRELGPSPMKLSVSRNLRVPKVMRYETES